MVSILRHPVAALRAHLRTRTRGQSLVELALILPVFMLFFATVLDLGRIAAAQIALTNAAREGAFQAAKTPSDFDASQPCPADGKTNRIYCRVRLEGGGTVTINPADVAVSCNPSDCSKGIGNMVTVRVTGHFSLLTPMMAAFFGGNQNVTFAESSTANIRTLPDPGAGSTTSSPSPSPSASPSSSASASPSPSPSPSIGCVVPSAGFTYTQSPSSKSAPSKVTFTDTSTSIACAIDSWFWVSTDGWTSSQQNPPTHNYPKAGTYFVTLTVHNAAGSTTSGAVEILVTK
jgi:Flp pilus assembly protein TadG